MVNVPTDIVEGIKELAEASEEEFETVKNEFLSIIKLPIVAESEDFSTDPEKAEAAFNILKARHFNSISERGNPFEGTIVEVLPPRTISIKSKDDDGNESSREARVCNLVGVMVPVVEDGDPTEGMDPSYAAITLWDDACVIVDEGIIERGKSYRMTLSGGKNQQGFYDLSSNVRPKVSEIDLKLPPLKDILPNIFPSVTIATAALNVSANRSDVKLMRAIVRSSRVVARKDNKGYIGFYNVIDTSIDTRSFKQNPRDHEFTIRCDASLLKYDTGSDLIFLGTINDDPTYGPGMWADMVLPVLPIPKVTKYIEAEGQSSDSGEGHTAPPEDAVDMSELI